MDTPIPRVGLRFLVFGPVELVLSVIVGNSALTSNGIDNLFDGLYLTLTGRVDDRLTRSPKHELYCKWRGRLGIVSSLVALPFIALGLILEHSRNQSSLTQMIVGLIVGSIGFGLTMKGHHEIEHHGDEHHGGFDAHLIQDRAAAVIAAISGVFAYGLAQPSCNLFGGYAILAVATAFGTREARRSYRRTDHSEESHDHEHEPDELHRRHATPTT